VKQISAIAARKISCPINEMYVGGIGIDTSISLATTPAPGFIVIAKRYLLFIRSL
jgi:hypothetical protein